MKKFEEIKEATSKPMEWFEIIRAIEGLRHRMLEFKTSHKNLHFFPSELNAKEIESNDEYSGNDQRDDSDKLSSFDFDCYKFIESLSDNDYHYNERKQLAKSNTITVIIDINNEYDFRYFHEIPKEEWIDFAYGEKNIISEIEKAFKYVWD